MSDYEYMFDEAEEGVSSSILLVESECEVVREHPPSWPTSADHRCTLPEVAVACQASPLRFVTSHSDCTDKVKDAGWSRDLAGHFDTIIVAGSQNTGETAGAVCGTDNERSEKKIQDDGTVSSQSDVDETKSFMNYSRVCDDVDWSELASARAAMQSSDDASSSWDGDAQSSTSDDEEPELRNLLVATLSELFESKTSEDYEKDTRENEPYDSDDQPEQTQERNNLIVNKNGTFEEVCLSSSTYYFACSGQDNGGGSCFVFNFHLHLRPFYCCCAALRDNVLSLKILLVFLAIVLTFRGDGQTIILG